MNILAVAGPKNASWFYRMETPLQQFVRWGHRVNVIQQVDLQSHLQNNMPKVASLLAGTDLVWLQRPSSEAEIKLMEKSQVEFRTPVLVDVDDHFLEYPAAWPDSKSVKANLDYCRHAIASANLVSCSTYALIEKLLPITKNLFQWDLSLDLKFLSHLGASKSLNFVGYKGKLSENDFNKWRQNKKLVLCSGTPSHILDLNHYCDQLITLAKKDKSIFWLFIGSVPKGFADVAPKKNWAVLGELNLFNYFPTLTAMGVDVLLAPLFPNEFNKCKSELKVIEAAIFGATLVATRIPAYGKYAQSIYLAEPTSTGFADAIKQALKIPRKPSVDLHAYHPSVTALALEKRLLKMNQIMFGEVL